MKLVVAVLSDIHLTTESSHPFLKRLDLIAAAIGSVEIAPCGLLIVLAGDIVSKGQPSEFEAMVVLVKRMREQLSRRLPGVPLHIVSVPGNHDLLHAPNSEDYRRNLIEGSAATLSEAKPNSVYLSQLLEPQNHYNTFAASLEGTQESPYHRLCDATTLTYGSHKVRVNLINSALTSRLHEQQGSLLLPLPILRERLEADGDSSFCITVMHHPLYWIDSNTLLDFRELLGRTTDYLLTGHQHFSSGYEVTDDAGSNVQYYESPAFYDPNQPPSSSAFRVLVFDLDGGKEQQLLFRWNGNLYTPDEGRDRVSSWRDRVQNRLVRPKIVMNPSFAESLNRPGFAYINKARPNVGLNELFVYPDLSQANGPGAAINTIKGRDVFSHLTRPGVAIVQGASLSGKTTLSKKLALDIRSRGDHVPVWLDGLDLSASNTEDLQTSIELAFMAQYSKKQLEQYLQLLPSQRMIVFDNWHLARLSAPLRTEASTWFKKFAGSSILFVDQVYQVKEWLSVSVADGSSAVAPDQDIERLVIGPLSNVSKAALIHRWIKSRAKLDSPDPETSKEARRIEDVVSALLGKDSLPAFAFYVLCVLEAFESKKTAAIAGGSFGPLFEILILSALEKLQSDDLQISMKLIFMQEIAFDMWKRRATSITTTEIAAIAKAYEEQHLLPLPVDRFLIDLQLSKLITSFDGNYSFAYPHYLYYSVARYFRDHLDDPESDDLRAQIDSIVDKISSIENSAIFMFLIYFERDKNRIIDRLATNAAKIFSSVRPAEFQDDAVIFSALPPMLPPPDIEEDPDIAANRDQQRSRRDEEAAAALKRPEATSNEYTVQNSYSYDESLSDSQKLHLTSQTIAALGQVIRTSSAGIDRNRKIEVIRQTYLLGLRSLGHVMQAFGQFIQMLPTMEGNPNADVSVSAMRARLAQAIMFITQLYSVAVLQGISSNVGVPDMDIAYEAVSETLDKTNAIRLIAVNIKMYHYAAFPEQEIIELHSDLKPNRFASNVLQWLVAYYLTFNRVDKKIEKSMIKLFRLNRAAIEAGRQ